MDPLESARRKSYANIHGAEHKQNPLILTSEEYLAVEEAIYADARRRGDRLIRVGPNGHLLFKGIEIVVGSERQESLNDLA